MALPREVQDDQELANVIDNNYDPNNTASGIDPHIAVGQFRFGRDEKYQIIVGPTSNANQSGQTGRAGIENKLQRQIGEATVSCWVVLSANNFGDDQDDSFEMLKELKRVVMNNKPDDFDWLEYISKSSTVETNVEPMRFAYQALIRYQYYTDES